MHGCRPTRSRRPWCACDACLGVMEGLSGSALRESDDAVVPVSVDVGYEQLRSNLWYRWSLYVLGRRVHGYTGKPRRREEKK